MNMQEAFIKAVKATLAQGKPSFEVRPRAGDAPDLGACFYRGPDGLKCSIGHLIPDDVWTPNMECGPVLTMTLAHPNALPFLSKERSVRDRQLDLLEALQQSHDIAALEGAPDFNRRFLEVLGNQLAKLRRPAAVEWLQQAVDEHYGR